MVKTLLNEVKEYKKDTLLSPIYVSIEAILEVFIPFLMALLVDNEMVLKKEIWVQFGFMGL